MAGPEIDTMRGRQRPNRLAMRMLVRDSVVAHLRANPGCSREQCIADVSDQLRDEFGDDNMWLELLLQILEILVDWLKNLVNS